MPASSKPLEDYGLIGNMISAALVAPRRLDRLAVPAALRLGRVLRGAARRPRERPLAASRPPTSTRRSSRRYLPDTAILETRFDDTTAAQSR